MNTAIDDVFPSIDKPDPTLLPAFSISNRLRRALWNVCWALLYRPSPRPLHAWRAFLLRCFGARLGQRCHFYPKSRVWAPWNLTCEDRVTAGDDCEVYNPSPFFLGSHCIVSQGAYLCGATHRYDDPTFPLVSYPKFLGAYSWVCARAVVGPRADMGVGAILGLAAVTMRSLDSFWIYAGQPAEKVKERLRSAVPEEYRL